MHNSNRSARAKKRPMGVATNQGIGMLAHMPKEEELSLLAYALWQARGCPEGSPQEDWFRAVVELRHTA